jgi:3-oxoacyl-[acyl-carrier protein] reductase
VTGASRGIGREIAVRLAADGYDVTLSARHPEPLAALAAETGAAYQVADMGVPDDIDRLAAFQLGRHDRLDVLVLCAGIGTAEPVAELPIRRAERQLNVNYLAALRLIQSLLPALRTAATHPPAHTAKIIALASITGVASEPALAAYGASKAALISLCQSVTIDEAGTGVTATAISPGYVDTDMTAWKHDELPAAEMMTAADVAELALAVCRLSRHAVVPNLVVTRPGSQLWRA